MKPTPPSPSQLRPPPPSANRPKYYSSSTALPRPPYQRALAENSPVQHHSPASWTPVQHCHYSPARQTLARRKLVPPPAPRSHPPPAPELRVSASEPELELELDYWPMEWGPPRGTSSAPLGPGWEPERRRASVAGYCRQGRTRCRGLGPGR